MEHEVILKMIEEVDPSDTAKMDEIDQKVSEYIEGRELKFNDDKVAYWGTVDWIDGECWVSLPRYTRSRDSLKRVRPNGYRWGFMDYGENSIKYSYERGVYVIFSPKLPTEELAELHAIIQAIAYERLK